MRAARGRGLEISGKLPEMPDLRVLTERVLKRSNKGVKVTPWRSTCLFFYAICLQCHSIISLCLPHSSIRVPTAESNSSDISSLLMHIVMSQNTSNKGVVLLEMVDFDFPAML